MRHALYCARLSLHSPFGTPLAGDTLFGQFCWAVRERQGTSELSRLLDGYTSGEPWLIASDGFPAGFLPKPVVPQAPGTRTDAEKRKDAKARKWIPLNAVSKPFAYMLDDAVTVSEAYGRKRIEAMQPHNTLSRRTGTTGVGEFAPYVQPQIFFARGQIIEVYLVLNQDRIQPETLKNLLADIGLQGYGRDASIGLGKFMIESLEARNFASSPGANAFWTLAPCAPQGLGFDPKRSYWRVMTRFGRHGSLHALGTNPFKNPVLLAATGALFAKPGGTDNRPFIGQGLGGSGVLSKTEPATVHQGYAPAVTVNLES